MESSAFNFEEYLAEAQAELECKQRQLTSDFGLGSNDTFVVDFERQILEFYRHEKLVAKAVILPVGTLVEGSSQFLWAWANEQYPAAVRSASEAVAGLYELTGFEMFRNKVFSCEAAMAWEVTALACKFLGAKGAYRIPAKSVDSFVLLNEVKHAA